MEAKFFPKFCRRIKVSAFASESNSATNGLVFIVEQYFKKPFKTKRRFLRLASN